MKRILIALAVLGAIGACVGYYLWNKPHADMSAAKTDVAIEATQLFNEYNADETAANAKYLDKTIAVSGKIKSSETVDSTTKVILETGSDFAVVCELDPFSKHARTTFTDGEQVVFKGKCSGISFDVQLVRCVEVK